MVHSTERIIKLAVINRGTAKSYRNSVNYALLCTGALREVLIRHQVNHCSRTVYIYVYFLWHGANTEMSESQPCWMWLAPKVNDFHRSVEVCKEVSAIIFANDLQISFWNTMLTRNDYRTYAYIQTYRCHQDHDQQYISHSVCLPRQVQCCQYNRLLHMTLCFINLIRHSITCGTALVTVYVILMQTTLHSHILALHDSLYTVFNRHFV